MPEAQQSLCPSADKERFCSLRNNNGGTSQGWFHSNLGNGANGPRRKIKSVIIIFAVVVLQSSFCKHEIHLSCPICLSCNILHIVLTENEYATGRQTSLSPQLILGTSRVLNSDWRSHNQPTWFFLLNSCEHISIVLGTTPLFSAQAANCVVVLLLS